jgi:hypothetical protein
MHIDNKAHWRPQMRDLEHANAARQPPANAGAWIAATPAHRSYHDTLLHTPNQNTPFQNQRVEELSHSKSNSHYSFGSPFSPGDPLLYTPSYVPTRPGMRLVGCWPIASLLAYCQFEYEQEVYCKESQGVGRRGYYSQRKLLAFEHKTLYQHNRDQYGILDHIGCVGVWCMGVN